MVLEASNDIDSDGRALMDEYEDCITAYVAGEFDSTISIEMVLKVS